MCEAHAFLLRGNEEEKILESVDEVYVEGQEVRLINIFGEQKILRARIKSYNNAQRKIILEERN
jgi:predicted RNA-binding protein